MHLASIRSSDVVDASKRIGIERCFTSPGLARTTRLSAPGAVPGLIGPGDTGHDALIGLRCLSRHVGFFHFKPPLASSWVQPATSSRPSIDNCADLHGNVSIYME